jgi:hypothetical protein
MTGDKIRNFSSPWRFSDCAANECQKFLFSEWLQQVTVRSIAHYFFSNLRIVYSGDESEWNTRIMLLHVQEKREPIYQR